MSGKTRSTVGSIFSVVGYVVGAAFSWTGVGAVVGYALIAAGAYLSYDGAKRQQREAERRARAGRRADAVRGNVRGTHEHHLLVFGKTRVGGIVVDSGTSNGADFTNQNLHLRVVHSLCHPGGCGGIEDFWIDDTRIDSTAITGDVYTGLRAATVGGYTGCVELRHWKGTGTQSADTDFPGSGGGATAYLRGMASTHFKLIRPNDDEKFRNVFKYGLPVCSVELKGITCYDPRLDSTNGGSGSHRRDDYTTWTWTAGVADNPAICAATYMMMEEEDGGMGMTWLQTGHSDFWASVAAAANICDEVAIGAKKRFTGMGVVLSTADRKDVNLQKILDCMMGKLVPVGSSYRMYAAAARTETFEIDDTWLAGPVTISTRNPAEGVYNAVRVNYDDNALDYKTIEAPPYTSSTYETQDGGIRRWQDVTLSGVTDGDRAQYIAQMFHKKSRYGATLQMVCNLKAMDLEVWETGSINLPANIPGAAKIAARVWRLAFYKDLGNGTIELAFEEDNTAIYTVDALQTPNTSGTSSTGFLVPKAPSGPSIAAVENGALMTWTNPARSTYEVIEIHRSDTSGGTFTQIAEVPVGVDRFTDRLETGAAKYYKLRARSKLYTFSSFTAELNPTTTPSAPTSPAANPVETGILITWTKPASDLAYEVTEIHRATSSGGTFSNAGEVASGGDRFIDRKTDAGTTYYYKVRTRNRLGIVSSFSSEVNSTSGMLTRAGSGTQLGDQRNIPTVNVQGLAAVPSANPLTGQNNGTIDVNAHTVRIGGVDISYNAVADVVTGLSAGNVRWIATDDPTYAGGTRTYTAYTSSYLAQQGNGRYVLGSVTIPSGGDTGGSYGGGSCVAEDQFVEDGRVARDLERFSGLLVRDDRGDLWHATVDAIERDVTACVEIIAESGARLVCAVSTPFTLPDGQIVFAPDMLDRQVFVRRGDAFGWERVSDVVSAGSRPVVRVHVGGRSYAAGSSPDALIYSHNPLKP